MKDWYSTAEVAERYDVTQRTVRNWLKEGHFPNATKVSPGRNSDWRIPQSDLADFDRRRAAASSNR